MNWLFWFKGISVIGVLPLRSTTAFDKGLTISPPRYVPSAFCWLQDTVMVSSMSGAANHNFCLIEVEVYRIDVLGNNRQI